MSTSDKTKNQTLLLPPSPQKDTDWSSHVPIAWKVFMVQTVQSCFAKLHFHSKLLSGASMFISVIRLEFGLIMKIKEGDETFLPV